jgi:transglutaminase-like putative cysteine protease
MTQRLRIVHRTGFRYDGVVAASYNEARMTPLTTPTQTALEARLEIDPVTWTYPYWDYWGTQVTAFEVMRPHEDLTVVSRSTVEVNDPLVLDSPVGWDELRSDDVLDQQLEYLQQTTGTTPAEEVTRLAAEAAAGKTPDQAARAVCVRLRELVEYRTGVTSVQTSAAEVWEAKSGVCQDFAHLTLGALRTLGIPARYVSGYLHPQPEAARGQTVEGESHAWVEWWVGDWVGFDPTSVAPVGTGHVMVGRGRDYSDIAPLRGIYAGPSGSQLFVSVEVTRLT